MPLSCLALFTGKLDGVLAARVAQELGARIEALYVQTPFNAPPDRAERAAAALGAPLHVIRTGDDYLALVRDPRFGYTRGASPGLDCRIHLFRMARLKLAELGAHMLVCGDVLGQRRQSQRKRDLEVIDYHAGVEGIVLRPLSARLLTPTPAERDGIIDRERLYAFHGSGRRELLDLARQFGLPELPAGGDCCALVRPDFAERVFELIRQQPHATAWHYELLAIGRHVQLSPDTKVIVGRRAAENEQLAIFHGRPDAPPGVLLEPDNFSGPTALLVGDATDDSIGQAIRILLSYARHAPPDEFQIRITNLAIHPPAPRHFICHFPR